MLQHLFSCHPQLRIQDQDLLDEIFGLLGDIGVRKGILTRFDLFVGHLHFIGFERWPPKEEGKADDAHGPDINLIGMPN